MSLVLDMLSYLLYAKGAICLAYKIVISDMVGNNTIKLSVSFTHFLTYFDRYYNQFIICHTLNEYSQLRETLVMSQA